MYILFNRASYTCSDGCLKDAASSAYAKTCAPYHTWAVRTAVYAGMYALPTRDQLLLKLNETSKFKFFTKLVFFFIDKHFLRSCSDQPFIAFSLLWFVNIQIG